MEENQFGGRKVVRQAKVLANWSLPALSNRLRCQWYKSNNFQQGFYFQKEKTLKIKS